VPGEAPPHLPYREQREARQKAELHKAIAEAQRYRGTVAQPDWKLADRENLGEVCSKLSKANLVPAQRARYFTWIDLSRCSIVGWSLTVDQVEVQGEETRVKSRVKPLLGSHEGGTLTVSVNYQETYRIVGDRITVIEAGPIDPNLPIFISGAKF
jgi:hypothetical protein